MGTDTLRRQAPATTPACRATPDLFHSDNPRDIAAAKAVCRDCPLQAACLDRALQIREPLGVWGGKDPDERSQIVKLRNRYGVTTLAVENRRAKVVELSKHMQPQRVAEVLGVPINTVYADRIRAGVTTRKVSGGPAEVARLRDAGLTILGIALQTGLGESTVKRYLTQQRSGRVAA